VRHVAAAGHLVVHLVALQHLAEEVDVPGGELQRLYLAQFVRGQRGDDFAQRRKRVVQRLRALPLAHVGQAPLVLQLLVRLVATRARLLDPLHGTGAAAAAAAAAVLAGLLALPLLRREAALLRGVQLLLAGHQTIRRGHRGAAALFHVFLEEMQG